MKLYGGIDLHANNSYLVLLDEGGSVVHRCRLPNEMTAVLEQLEPYREQMVELSVESTYNWYWVVDGLKGVCYSVKLANPKAMQQYQGLKYSDNKSDTRWLGEMLRTMPKHKGTDHLQAEVKTRIRELTEELAGPKKGGTHGGPATVVRSEGAAQLALLGPPNAGKSLLHARLTGSNAAVGPYPFTTSFPQPGRSMAQKR